MWSQSPSLLCDFINVYSSLGFLPSTHVESSLMQIYVRDSIRQTFDSDHIFIAEPNQQYMW